MTGSAKASEVQASMLKMVLASKQNKKTFFMCVGPFKNMSNAMATKTVA
jgi:recombinational DNA repair protein RecT